MITKQDIIDKYSSIYDVSNFQFINGYGNAIIGVANRKICYSMKRIIEISMDSFGLSFGSSCDKVNELMEKYPQHIFVDDILGTM